MSQNTNHVVMQGNQFVCLHCGRRYTPTLPAPINVATAMMKAFVKDHEHCKAPAEPAADMAKRFDNSDFQTFGG